MPRPAMNSRSGTTARVPSRKVTTTSWRDSGFRETKNQPHTTEGIMATPAACRKIDMLTSLDAPCRRAGLESGPAALVACRSPRLQCPSSRLAPHAATGMVRDLGHNGAGSGPGRSPKPCQPAGPLRVFHMGENVDAARVRACLAGDSRAFAGLVAEYEKPVYNLALR